MRIPLWLPALALAAAACGSDGSSGPSTGSIAVTTTTGGSDLDPDGYGVAVDGGTAQAMGINDALTIDG